MRFLADLHIAPRTVAFLGSLGHDAIRVTDLLAANASDTAIVAEAVLQDRVILTQDLDFSAIVALSGAISPSVVSLRLSTADVEAVNVALAGVLPMIEDDLRRGAIVSVEDKRVRVRRLPVSG